MENKNTYCNQNSRDSDYNKCIKNDKFLLVETCRFLSYRHEKDGFAFFVDGFEPSDYECGYKTPMGNEL